MTIDVSFFGYGVSLPLLGYCCGVILRVVLDTLKTGGQI